MVNNKWLYIFGLILSGIVVIFIVHKSEGIFNVAARCFLSHETSGSCDKAISLFVSIFVALVGAIWLYAEIKRGNGQ